MSPPPRRGAGKGRGGRGGGGGGDRRPNNNNSSNNNGISNSSDAPTATSSKQPKKRERGNSNSSGKGRGGGRGGGGGGSSAASASSSAAASSARSTRAVTTVLKKLVVRNIPPTASEQEARELLQAHGVGDEFVWRFVPGRKRSSNRAPTPARLYLDMKKDPERARKLIASLHGQPFYPEAKDSADAAKLLDVEFAPFQKIPREKQRKDAKVGTIDRDPEYMAFLEELAKPKDKLPSAEAVADMTEGEAVEKPVAALVKYLNERKVHSRDKGKGKSGGKSLDKSGARRQKGKKDGSKQKSTKDKSKASKDRPNKKNADATSAQDSAKNRKQRGKMVSKRDSTKQESFKPEPNQPGMLRIMTPKSAAPSGTAGDSTPAPAAKSNGTTASAEAPAERGSEKRPPMPGKKKGGRGGRNNPKKGKDGGDGADGEGAGKADAKPHPRRKGGNSGKKEPNNKGERKKVFAPKDSTAQGTAAKS